MSGVSRILEGLLPIRNHPRVTTAKGVSRLIRDLSIPVPRGVLFNQVANRLVLNNARNRRNFEKRNLITEDRIVRTIGGQFDIQVTPPRVRQTRVTDIEIEFTVIWQPGASHVETRNLTIRFGTDRQGAIDRAVQQEFQAFQDEFDNGYEFSFEILGTNTRVFPNANERRQGILFREIPLFREYLIFDSREYGTDFGHHENCVIDMTWELMSQTKSRRFGKVTIGELEIIAGYEKGKGMTLLQTQKICEKYKIAMKVLDSFDNLRYEYVTPKKTKDIKPLMFMASDNHCYQITDLTDRRKLSHRDELFLDTKPIVNDSGHKMSGSCDVEKKVTDTEIVYVNTSDELENMFFDKFKDSKRIPMINNTPTHKLSRLYYKSENKEYKLYRHFELARKLGFKLDVPFSKSMEKIIKLPNLSYYHPVVKEIIDEWKVRPWNDTFEIPNINEQPVTYDITKCYSSCLRECDKFGWGIYDFRCKFVEWKGGDIKPGQYMITTKNSNPFRGNGRYYDCVVEKAKKMGVEFEINGWMEPSEILDSNYFTDFVDEMYTKLGVDGKHMVNIFTGQLGKRYDTKIISRFTTSKDEISLFSEKGYGYKNFGGELFEIYKIHRTEIHETYRPLYEKIIQLGGLRVRQLSDKLGGKLLKITVDSVTVVGPNEIKLSENKLKLGSYHFEKKDSYSFSDHLFRPEYRNIVLPSFKIKWKVVSKDKFTGGFLSGNAGVGKSRYLNNDVIPRLEKDNIKIEKLAYMWSAAESIGDASTLHKYLNISKLDSKTKSAKFSKVKKETLIIDEALVAPMEMMKYLTFIKDQKNVNMIFSGGQDQIKSFDYPFMEHKDEFWFYWLCGGIVCEIPWTENSRYSMEDKIEMELIVKDKTRLKCKETEYGICFFNNTKKRVDKKNNVRILDGKSGVVIKKSKTYTRSQDVELIDGMDLIANSSSKTGIKNGQQFVIISIDNEKMIIKNKKSGDEIKIDNKDFNKYLELDYCITVYRSQSKTYDFEYTIYDWDRISKIPCGIKTAITRTTDLKKVFREI